jgi:hypothetical protein
VSEKTCRTYRRVAVGYWPRPRALALARFHVRHLLAALVLLTVPKCLEWSLDRGPSGLVDSAQWRAAHGLNRLRLPSGVWPSLAAGGRALSQRAGVPD